VYIGRTDVECECLCVCVYVSVCVLSLFSFSLLLLLLLFLYPSLSLLPPSLAALYLSQHQGLFTRVSSSHQVAKVLEFQLQHQSFQCTLRGDFLAVQGALKSIQHRSSKANTSGHSAFFIGEGNGNPLQHSCLENPMDGGSW